MLAIEWWLSHCKYWFVWVGFLYMEVDKLPSSFTVTKVPRKGNDPSSLVFSAVNWIFFFYTIYMLEELFFVCCLQSVIHKSLPEAWGVWCCLKGLGFKMLHIYISHYGAEWWPHCCTFYLFKMLPLKNKIGDSQAKLQQIYSVIEKIRSKYKNDKRYFTNFKLIYYTT